MNEINEIEELEKIYPDDPDEPDKGAVYAFLIMLSVLIFVGLVCAMVS